MLNGNAQRTKTFFARLPLHYRTPTTRQKIKQKKSKTCLQGLDVIQPAQSRKLPFYTLRICEVTYKKDRRLSPVCGNFQPVSEVLSYILQNLQ